MVESQLERSVLEGEWHNGRYETIVEEEPLGSAYPFTQGEDQPIWLRIYTVVEKTSDARVQGLAKRYADWLLLASRDQEHMAFKN